MSSSHLRASTPHQRAVVVVVVAAVAGDFGEVVETDETLFEYGTVPGEADSAE